MESLKKNDCFISKLLDELERTDSTENMLIDYLDSPDQTLLINQILFPDTPSNTDLTVQEAKNRLKSYLSSSSLITSSQFLTDEYLSIYYSSKVSELQEADELGLDINVQEQSTLDSLWSDNSSKMSDNLSSAGSSQKRLKGLRNISSKIKELIYTRGFYSYREVADALLEDSELLCTEVHSKVGRNVLRRVYDAINVLLAAGVIENNGTKYTWQLCKREDEEVEKIIMKKRRRVEAKREEFQEIVQNFLAMKQLVKRNKQLRNDEFIPFPFIVLATEESPENRIKVEMNKIRCELNVGCRKEIKKFRDLDLIRKIDLDVYFSDLPLEAIDLLSGINLNN